MPGGRSPDRIRKTIAFPKPLHERLQNIADERHRGDFSAAVIYALSEGETDTLQILERGAKYRAAPKQESLESA